jgi:predicted AlkP superfamily phosphohydrolase/phosphomutase
MAGHIDMNRRSFIKKTTTLAAGLWFYPIPELFGAKEQNKKMIVLGVDGMDPHLTRQYMLQGLLPNIKKLVMAGSFNAMSTSTPAQSPVAWSNISVGAETSVHGIYDFIHRNPKDIAPFLSTSQVESSSRILRLGNYNLPLSSGKTFKLQKGIPFWEYLAERDIPTTLFKIPANFPCDHKKVEMVSGMGTPDLRGGYGNYTLYTTDPLKYSKDITGGRIVEVKFNEGRVNAKLPGPENSFKDGNFESHIPFKLWRDSSAPVIRIKIQNHELLLQKGEWSEWLQLSFPMLGPLVDVKGICKIFIKSVQGEFSMYISPINIDPSEPSLPVISPSAYGRELTEANGFFYTQGFPEDTKALSEGIFTEDEYLSQAMQVYAERDRLLEFELNRFKRRNEGFLFFYISSLDQNSHMYWRSVDKKHPLYSPELEGKYGSTLKTFYSKVDKSIGKLLGQFDINDPAFSLMIMSDHGFLPFRRQINLNSWLHQNGYLALNNNGAFESDGYFSGVNWERTGAYNVGINAIYLNKAGREPNGVVLDNQAERVRQALRKDLLSFVDSETGTKVVSNVKIISESERKLHPHAPDLIVGWNNGYRTSWDSILGGISPEIISDNLDKWSGDHCVDPALVPAVLISNKKNIKPNPNICDIAPTILSEFNIGTPKAMQGKPLYKI